MIVASVTRSLRWMEKIWPVRLSFFARSNGLSGLYYLAFGKSFLLIEFFSDVVKLTTCNLSNTYFQNNWVDPLKNKVC